MTTSQSIFSSLIWRFAERFSAQALSLVVSIILARLLMPEDYGKIALISIVVAIPIRFVDVGMGSALVQKKDADDLDFSSVFFFNVAACLLIYLLIFVTATLVAEFLGDVSLTPMIRVIGTIVIIAGLKNIQQAFVLRNMLFKTFFYANLISSLVAAAVGIGMAYGGLGVWALIAQTITSTLMGTVMLWFLVKWRPHLEFSYDRLRGLIGFGWKLLASVLLDMLYGNLRSLIIGKKYSPSDLAYYCKAEQFPKLGVMTLNTSISSVLFPAFSREQSDLVLLKAHVRKAIQVSSGVMWPIVVGLFVCARPLISFVLTDKWLPCVPYMQIYCVCYGLIPIHSTNLEVMKALGRSDLFLKLEAIKKSLGIAMLLAVMNYGVMAIALSAIVMGLLGTVINAWPNRRLIGYTYWEQVKDTAPSLLAATAMGVAVYQWQWLKLPAWGILLLQVVSGVMVYLLLAWLLKLECFVYARERLTELRHRH